MSAYYNEIDPYAAQWLRNLIAAGLIAPGDVDERSIVDVVPGDLRGYAQCHFFAGLGGWSGALRLAGWADDRSVWTGSCPCQPFSAAGKRKGFADARHLWPVWADLIRECSPAIVFGEQVARAADWLALVRGELEAMGYAVGCLPIEAASVGAPHLRDRAWFVADASRGGPRRDGLGEALRRQLDYPGADVADADCGRRSSGQQTAPTLGYRRAAGAESCTISNAKFEGLQGLRTEHELRQRPDGLETAGRGWWAVEPDVGRVAYGVPARVAKLRALGNAIVRQAGAAFVSAFMECRP